MLLKPWIFRLIRLGTPAALIWALSCLMLACSGWPDRSLAVVEQDFSNEHIYGSAPDDQPFLARRGYALCYDDIHRVPKWVAYHVTPDYRNTPSRAGKYKRFRTDPDIVNPVRDDDYNGLFDSPGNFARGHLAPYGVMGGDRDEDGLYAADDDNYDNNTVFEANYMSNIAPQNHYDFNGSGGLWYKLERWIQDDVVEERGLEVWIFAGCIFGPGDPEMVGPDNDIAVPPMFYKIVIRKDETDNSPIVLAFLFPHQRSKHGNIEDFLVTVDVIEEMTGLDFFSDLDDDAEMELERTDTWDNWQNF